MTDDIKTATFDPGDGGLPYRLGVLLVVFNRHGEIFAGKSHKEPADGKAWQLPQGGRKMVLTDGVPHYERTSKAARRELKEELGTATKLELIKMLPEPVVYDFPDANAKYRGQMLIPVLVRCHNNNAKFDIGRQEEGDAQPAFSAWKWLKPDSVLDNVTAVKAAIYQQVLTAFLPVIAADIMTQSQRRNAVTLDMVRPHSAVKMRQKLNNTSSLNH